MDSIKLNDKFTNITDSTQYLLNKNNELFIINKITLAGNKRTKKHVILREIDFREGDTLHTADVEALFKKNRNQIYNTGLFNDVTIKIASLQPLSPTPPMTQDSTQKTSSSVVDVIIKVEERWYILPVPIFQLTDRNFNDWWVTHQRDLSRTEYGFQFIDSNFRGRREKLKVLVQLGYTQKYELAYQVPFLDKTGKVGLSIASSYSTNREIAWRTFHNKREFYKDTIQQSFSRFRAGLSASYRPDMEQTHRLEATYTLNTISDTLAQINPDYFLNGRTKQSFPSINYSYVTDHRDIRSYPLHGYFFRVNVSKFGLSSSHDINMLSILMGYSNYFQVSKRWYGLVNAHGRVSFPEKQPYYNQQGLGYGTSYLRGYEYYVIDGQHFGLFRTAWKYEIVKTKFKNPILKGDQFRTLPLAIYLKTYAETAYVKDSYYFSNNPLSNKWLASGGFGVDIFSVYDMVLTLEYSWNIERESGFFVAFRVGYD